MIAKKEFEKAKKKALVYFEKACITLTEEEKRKIEIADFGLDQIEKIGIQIITYVNTDPRIKRIPEVK